MFLLLDTVDLIFPESLTMAMSTVKAYLISPANHMSRMAGNFCQSAIQRNFQISIKWACRNPATPFSNTKWAWQWIMPLPNGDVGYKGRNCFCFLLSLDRLSS